MLTALGDIQIPVLAAMLLGACAAKAGRVIRGRSIAAGLGATALFPMRLQRWAAITLCVVEFGFGIGLIVTSGPFGAGRPAELVRLGAGLLFVVATLALIELRSVRPDIGCGCFGEFSTAPISWRTLSRSALLAVAAIGCIRVHIQLPRTSSEITQVLTLLFAEFALFGLLSPELRDVMVKIGYSAPCELRVQSAEQTLAVLQRSAQWRKHAALIADQNPADIWRELCWRYIAFPSRHADRDAELVFAIYLQHRRPTVFSVLVDATTGAILPWPAGAVREARWWQRPARRRLGLRRPVSPLVRGDTGSGRAQ